MKYLIFVIVVITMCSCWQKNVPVVKEKFVVKTYSIALGANVQTTIDVSILVVKQYEDFK